ncbi:MAG TPA: lysophospholipid acyltransferase family protein [Acetobacteraceae bacterium]|nr:lysophospholipid acyltransferase family protein [Acetobacteraceae bacterium]
MPDEHPARVRSPLACAMAEPYLRWYFKRNFHAVRIARDGLPAVVPGRSVIVCSNHPSWWDPALFALLTRMLFPGRAGYGPMDADALGKYRVLRRIGVFGIEAGPRGAARFLRIGLDLLADPATLLWITAEGAFTDPRVRPVRLRPGIAHLARRTNAVILPLAIELPFWNERKPEALVRFGPPVNMQEAPLPPERGERLGEGGAPAKASTARASPLTPTLSPARGGEGECSTVAVWTAAFEQALTACMDALAAAAMSRDPARFTTLLQGETGVGGIYDLWRRAAAWGSGRRFDPSHGGEA